jgi:hypothetical protein
LSISIIFVSRRGCYPCPANAALHGARPKGALRCKRQLGIAYSPRNYHRRYWTTMPVYPVAPSD